MAEAPTGDAPTPFNPLVVSGCRLWYDAAHVTVVDGSTTAIPDQSGNGRDATVTGVLAYTATNASYDDGPTINRADATDEIAMPDLGLTTGAFTLVFVGDAPAAAANFLIRITGGVDIRAQSSKYRASEDGGATELEVDEADTTVPVVLVVVYNGAASRVYASSLGPAVGSTGPLPDLTGLGGYIGDVLGGGFGDLNMRHGLVYDGAKSPAEVDILLNGFGVESNIAIADPPFDPVFYAPTEFWRAPDFTNTGGFSSVGTWAARAGNDATASDFDAPTASAGGAPVFASSGTRAPSKVLTNDDIGAAGAGDCYVFAVVDFASITNDDSGSYYNCAVTRLSGNCGITVFRTGSGPYSYFANFEQTSGEEGDPSTLLGTSAVTIDISDAVDATGAGRVVFQARKQGGNVQLAINAGNWVVGDVCFDFWTPAAAGSAPFIGTGYGADAPLDATPQVVAWYDSVPDFSTAQLLAWVTGQFP